MKKILFLLCLCLLFFVSCEKEEDYTPDLELAEGYLLEGDRITAELIGTGPLTVSDFLITKDAVTVFADSTGDRYVQGLDAELPLKDGENRMVLRLENGGRQKEYELHITCISIRSFSVAVNDPEKTYHIGEAFDKSTITVTALTADGKEIEITRYEPEYEFSSLGKSTVGIELDGFYESFSVMVTEQYRPVLDENGFADGVYYEISEDSAVLLRATEKEGFFSVPSSVVVNGKEYPVTEIAPLAFEGAWLTGVQIPSGVKRIADEAFSGCRRLEWAELPETMENIGSFAFSDCEALFSIAVPDGVEEIKNGTFRGCKSLVRAVLPQTVTAIGERAFFDCTSLSGIDLPHKLSVIEDSAFENCEALTAVVAETLDTLGSRAFAGCKNMTVFAAGEIENIGTEVFSEGKELTVYMRAGSMLLMAAERAGADSVFMKDGEYTIVSLPTEFPIEEDFPYAETLILHLGDGRMTILSDYEVFYPKDACGYLEACITAEDFEHRFTVFISYTENVALDTDTRGVRYELDPATGRATLVYAPAWVKKSDIYNPEKDGLFIVPTTLIREDAMYVVTAVADGAFDEVLNAENVFIPKLTKE